MYDPAVLGTVALLYTGGYECSILLKPKELVEVSLLREFLLLMCDMQTVWRYQRCCI